MNFFQKYNKFIIALYITVVGAIVVLLGWQSYLNYTTLLRDVTYTLEQQIDALEYQIKTSRGYVSLLQKSAEDYLEESRRSDIPSPLFNQIQDLPYKPGYFGLDNPGPSYSTSKIGNLSGLGSIKDFDEETKREIKMALSLNQLFYIIGQNVPNAAWLYYTSKREFRNFYNWMPSNKSIFFSGMLLDGYFIGSTPQNNPNRQAGWSDLYKDEEGKGLMVTCYAPVYDRDDFLGAVSIDFSVDELEKFLATTPLNSGKLLLIDNKGTVLTDYGVVSVNDPSTTNITSVLPADLKDKINDILHLEEDKIIKTGSYVCYVHSTKLAPWKVLYFAPQSHFIFTSVKEIFCDGVIILLLLTGMIFLINRLVKREFIKPAEQLVNYIDQQNQGKDGSIPLVSAEWLPWFEEVQGVFKENRSLVSQLQEQIKTLDQQVAKRTEELQAKNSALEKTLEDLSKAQKQIITQEKLASLGSLTAGIAHELKNPLNFIINFSETTLTFAQELKADLEGVKEHIPANMVQDIEELLNDIEGNISKIYEHGRRSDSIIRGMLMHARGSSGEIMEVKLSQLIDDSSSLAISAFQGQNNGFEVIVIKRYDSSIPKLLIFGQDLGRVILNIVNNSCYAMARKAGSLSKEDNYHPTLEYVTTSLADKVEIRIKDNGPGIPEEVKARLFEPFFTTKPTGQGTGLGLSLSHDIVVQQHGGSLEVNTEPGQYTEMVITIPQKIIMESPA